MDIVSLFRLTNGLATTRRFSQSRLHHEESVLEHLGFVTLVVNLVGRECNDISPGFVDLGLAMLKASGHDTEEMITGDIPRPTKYYNDAASKAFEEVAEHGMATVMAELKMRPSSATGFIVDWRDAKDGQEGLLVAVADLTAVVWKMWAEIIMMNNLSLMLSCSSIITYLGDLRAKIIVRVPDAKVRQYLTRFVAGLEEIAQVATEKYRSGVGTANFEV